MNKRRKTFLPSTFYLPPSSGLTVIELVVVVAIVAVISGVIIFNYSDFKVNATLRGLSQEVALAIRKAQTYATSVQSISIGGTTTSFPAYGISFSIDSTTPNPATPSNRQFVLFADIASSRVYSNSGTCGVPVVGNECIESFTINSADRIIEVCADATCMPSGTVDIIFERPAPDALICISGSCSYSSASIKVGSSVKYRVITVWNTGQISVQ